MKSARPDCPKCYGDLAELLCSIEAGELGPNDPPEEIRLWACRACHYEWDTVRP